MAPLLSALVQTRSLLSEVLLASCSQTSCTSVPDLIPLPGTPTGPFSLCARLKTNLISLMAPCPAQGQAEGCSCQPDRLMGVSVPTCQ